MSRREILINTTVFILLEQPAVLFFDRTIFRCGLGGAVLLGRAVPSLGCSEGFIWSIVPVMLANSITVILSLSWAFERTVTYNVTCRQLPQTELLKCRAPRSSTQRSSLWLSQNAYGRGRSIRGGRAIRPGRSIFRWAWGGRIIREGRTIKESRSNRIGRCLFRSSATITPAASRGWTLPKAFRKYEVRHSSP